MKFFILKDNSSSGNVYFKGYSPYTEYTEWTGVEDRACFWKAWECANEQALGLNMKNPYNNWVVVTIEDIRGES